MKKFKIRTAKSLKKILEKKPRNEREQLYYYYLKGIYDSRMFGLCRYRLKPSCDFKNLIICNVRLSCFQEVWQRWCEDDDVQRFDNWLHDKMHEA